MDEQQIPATIVVNNKPYSVEKPVGAGYKGVVWKVLDEFGRSRALKLAIHEDYDTRSYLQELSRAARLSSCAQFAHFIDAGVTDLQLSDLPPQKFIAFLEDWVPGETLDKFVVSNAERITAPFIVAYIGALCTALNALRLENLTHDDLHMQNVMISPPPPGDLIGDWRVRVIDTGSLKPMPTVKKKDDHRHFVEHIVALCNAVRRRRAIPIRDRRFLAEAETLIATMLDDDPSVSLHEPSQILERFQSALSRSNFPRSLPSDSISMRSPFDFISAEHIADDRLLVRIFAKSCPWLAKVNGPDPCLVTGPRGCGKSTIFRWLSLKAHLHKPTEELSTDLATLELFGFYLSCSADLQNRLGWIQSSGSAERFQQEIIHYFNLLATREVAHTLDLIASREDRDTLWDFGKPKEIAVHRYLSASLGRMFRPRIQGVSHMQQAIDAIEAEMFATHAAMLRGLNLEISTPATFLGDLTTFLTDTISTFRAKRIAFLVDDFSTHRLPSPVQEILNRVIWERRSSHVFKLSSEKFGAVLADSSRATIELNREMVEIDCGREYIALDDANQKARAFEFAVELLDNRLDAAGFQGRAATLIGTSRWPEDSLARALIDRGAGRRQSQYHGLECISSLCSGDVSTLLFIYRRIFESANINKDSTGQVAKNIQHAAITSASRELLEAIKPFFPHGPAMYSIVNEFGTLVRRILEQGRWQKKGSARVPVQAPRIEIDQQRGYAVDELNREQRELADELIRRAIFIKMDPGLSRHMNVTTLRWNLRRVYLPAFSAALAKNDAIKRDPTWLKFFLTDPKAACDTVWRSWPKELAHTGLGMASLPTLDANEET